MNLPKKTLVRFATAGIIYILGALGVEMLSAPFFNLQGNGDDTFVYLMYQTVEETLELLGVLIFVYGLTTYIRDQIKDISIKFDKYSLALRI